MGSENLSWKVFIPVVIFFIIYFAFTFVVRIGKVKILSIREDYRINIPYFDIMRPLIMIYAVASICLLLPLIIMPYIMGCVFFFIGFVTYEYYKIWKLFGFSISSYIIVLLITIVLAIITSILLKNFISIIISFLGRYYNVI